MVSMLLYVWSREYPNAQINIYGLIPLRVRNITVPSFSYVAQLMMTLWY
jgi:hypothetical protein